MRRFTIISLLASLSLLCSSLARSELASAVSRPVLMLTQSVDSAGNSTLTGKVGNLGYSNTGFGVSQAATVRSDQLPAGIEPLQLTAGASRDAVAQAATTWATQKAPTLAASIESYMNQYGLSSAWFVYEQRVNVPAAGGSGVAQLRVSWSLFEDAKGRVSYGAPRLEPLSASDVRVLKVSYAAKAVAEGLPASFANPNGGILSWQVLNSSLAPLSGANTSGAPNMNGAFDPPTSGAVDDRSALRSLISKSSASLDVKRLLAQTGATLAIVDYTYPPEPQYAAVAGTDSLCPSGAAGSRCYAAVGSYNFTRREVFTACGMTPRYENDVTYAFNVETITDRFIVDPASLEANAIQRFTDVKIGAAQTPPTLKRDLSGAEVVSLTPASPLVLNPFDGLQLIASSQLVGSVALADVKRTDAPCAPMSASVSPSSHNVATTGSFTVTGGGGLPPYSYNWYALVDYAGGSISIGNSTARTTTISRSGPSMGPAGGVVGYVDVRVTDSLGAQATARVTLTINPDPPLQVDITAAAKWSPAYGTYAAEGSCSSAEGMCTASTAAAPIAISGGTGSYNVGWVRLAGDVATVNQPSSANTTFTRDNPTQPADGTPLRRSGLYRITVYDGRSTVSKDLAVETLHTRTVLAQPLKADFVGSIVGCDQGKCYPDPQVIVTGGVAPYTYSWSISKVPEANVNWMDPEHSHALVMGNWGNKYTQGTTIFQARVTVTDSLGSVAFTKTEFWRKLFN